MAGVLCSLFIFGVDLFHSHPDCANAIGRLVGTLMSGWLFQFFGLYTCLWASGSFLVVCAVISVFLPPVKQVNAVPLPA